MTQKSAAVVIAVLLIGSAIACGALPGAVATQISLVATAILSEETVIPTLTFVPAATSTSTGGPAATARPTSNAMGLPAETPGPTLGRFSRIAFWHCSHASGAWI